MSFASGASRAAPTALGSRGRGRRSDGASSRPARSRTASPRTWPWCPARELAAVGLATAAERRRPSPPSTAPRAAYGSYEELVADPAVDVVYVATPHALHLDHARLAFEAGKHVLCEKPLTLNAAEAEEMVALARQHDRFLMEAMWTACHPVVRRLAADVRGRRASGRPRHLHAELGFRVDAAGRGPDARPRARRERPAGHGDLPADLRPPAARRGRGAARRSPRSPRRGIDLDVAMAGRYPGGALATMTASMTSWSSRAAAHRHRPRPDRPRRLPPPDPRHLHAVRRRRLQRRRRAPRARPRSRATSR